MVVICWISCRCCCVEAIYSLSPGSVFFARLTDRKSSECNYSVEVYALPPRTDVCLGLVLFCAGVTNFSAMPEAEATKCPLPEFFSGGGGGPKVKCVSSGVTGCQTNRSLVVFLNDFCFIIDALQMISSLSEAKVYY